MWLRPPGGRARPSSSLGNEHPPRPKSGNSTCEITYTRDLSISRTSSALIPGSLKAWPASGTITNVGRNAQHVPGLRLVLRDAGDKIVYQWDIAPPRRDLAPGESMTINEARTDVPRSARFAEIGWKPE